MKMLMEAKITAALALAPIFGMFTLNVADSKGHSKVAWFFGGFLTGPVALIAACGLSDKRLSRTLRRLAEHQNVTDLPELEFDDDDLPI